MLTDCLCYSQSDYGFCDKTVTVTAEPSTSTSALPQPTAAFHVKAVEHADCGGNVQAAKEVGKDEGVCINTDCHVAALDMAGAGSCPDGQVQISYWQNPQCTGEWYGYGYTSRDTCRTLWSAGGSFQSLHLRCADRKDDCISKGTCVADREPSVGVCEQKPKADFAAKSHYHADCTGDVHDNVETSAGNGICVETDCQVASFDIASEGSCPDGHVQLSYWEQAGCQGAWYGYGYSSRATCRRLWSDGWNFKSVHMRCTDPKDDCVNKGTCTVDPEPNSHKC